MSWRQWNNTHSVRNLRRVDVGRVPNHYKLLCIYLLSISSIIIALLLIFSLFLLLVDQLKKILIPNSLSFSLYFNSNENKNMICYPSRPSNTACKYMIQMVEDSWLTIYYARMTKGTQLHITKLTNVQSIYFIPILIPVQHGKFINY